MNTEYGMAIIRKQEQESLERLIYELKKAGKL